MIVAVFGFGFWFWFWLDMLYKKDTILFLEKDKLFR